MNLHTNMDLTGKAHKNPVSLKNGQKIRGTGFLCGEIFGERKGAGMTSHFFRRDVLVLEFYNGGNGRKFMISKGGKGNGIYGCDWCCGDFSR